MNQEAPRQTWFKSSYSGGADNECVEVRFGFDRFGEVGVRDSKNPARSSSFPPGAFAAFRRGL